MSQNKSSNFFKFQNVQIVRRPNAAQQTRQNTQIDASQGTAEVQFVAIEAATCGEALNVVDNLLLEDESVDYSATQPKTLNTQV